MRRGPRLLAGALVVAALVAPWMCPARGAGGPDIVLTKSLSDDYAASPDHRKYMVLPGDSLYRVFRKFGITGPITRKHLARFREMNPSVRNIDLLYPGQVLLIPLPGTTGSTAPSAPRRGGGSPGTAPPPSGDDGSPDSSVPIPTPETAPFLVQAFSRLGETARNDGTFFLPIETTGSLALDGARYPMIALGNGIVILVDTEGTLTGPLKTLVEETWPNYRIVNLEPGATPEDALGRVLVSSGYHSVDRGRELVLGKDVKVSLRCDWLVEKTPDSILNGSLVAVNLAAFPREVIPQSIRDYAGRYNIEILNLPEGAEAVLPEPDAATPARAEHLEGESAGSLLDALCARMGIPAQPGREIRLLRESGSGVSLTFRADRVVTREDARVAVSFHGIAPSMEELLQASGWKSVSLAGRQSAGEMVPAVLEALGIRYFGPDIQFYQEGDLGTETFVVTIPGIFTRHGGENILFTSASPDRHILEFLARRNVRVIRL